MERLHTVVREFIDAIVNPYDVAEVLNRLTTNAKDALDAAGVGIMLRTESGELEFAAASSEGITEIERRQDVTHTGPCYDAFHGNCVVAVEDLRVDDRWPGYSGTAISQGLVAVLGVPMHAHGQAIGVVNF
jgi:GAF domain-containing protein